MNKEDFLKDPVKHIDIKSFDSTEIIEAMKDMSFTQPEIPPGQQRRWNKIFE